MTSQERKTAPQAAEAPDTSIDAEISALIEDLLEELGFHRDLPIPPCPPNTLPLPKVVCVTNCVTMTCEVWLDKVLSH